MLKDDIKQIIIRKLVGKRMWGGKHTEHVLAGLPKHLLGSKEATEAVQELIKDRWLLPAKKTRETHYSLNPQKAGEILQFYDRKQ